MITKHMINRSSLTAAWLTCIMLIFVYMPIPFLFGIELFLFTIVSWFVYYRYSLNHALFLTLTGAAFGILLWDQSPLFAFYPVEILLVGWVAARSKRSTVFWDLVYWLTIGLLIFYPSYQWLTDWSDSNVVTFFLFSVANGLMNVFFGGLASEYLPNRGSTTKKRWRIGRVSFHLCMILMIVPMLIYLLVSGYFSYQKSLYEISTRLNTIYGHVNDRLNHLTETDLRNLKVRSTVQKASVQNMFVSITTGTDVQLTLLDANHHVITTLEPEVADNTAYDWKGTNTVKQVTEDLYVWQPDYIPVYTDVYRWANSEYVSVYNLERLPYTLIVKQPVTSYQHNMFSLYLISLLLIGISTVVSALVAYSVTSRLSKSIAQLGNFTTGLPRRIRLREAIEWEDSPLHEVELLKNNFEDMSQELASMFHEINDSEEKLRHMVHYDSLTELGNRYSFGLYLPSLIQTAKENNTKVACLFIDLDRFKLINDTYGHEAGDVVLKEVGKRLGQHQSDQTKVFRLSGDEFVIVISDPLPDDLIRWAQAIHSDVMEPAIICRDIRIEIELSSGIAIYPEHGQDAQGLLRSSDHAMYQAKINGRNRVKLSTGTNIDFPQKGVSAK